VPVGRYVIAPRGKTLELELMLSRREGPLPFRLGQAPCSRAPSEAPRLCFKRTHGSRPGPDMVELSLEHDHLHLSVGFGPQHGAKVFEEPGSRAPHDRAHIADRTLFPTFSRKREEIRSEDQRRRAVPAGVTACLTRSGPGSRRAPRPHPVRSVPPTT
jgi:hypothetical protein